MYCTVGAHALSLIPAGRPAAGAAFKRAGARADRATPRRVARGPRAGARDEYGVTARRRTYHSLPSLLYIQYPYKADWWLWIRLQQAPHNGHPRQTI